MTAKPFYTPLMDLGRPHRDDCVLPWLLERNARETPGREQIRFDDGEAWTCAETVEQARRSAGFFAHHGIQRGDLVLAWMPSGVSMLRTWFGLNYLGAVVVPINVDYRGAILQHAIRESGAVAMVLHPQLLERLELVDELPLRQVFCVGASPGDLREHDVPVIATDLVDAGTPVEQPADVDIWDLQMVIFTSGTTGPSKGVMCPYGHMYMTGVATYGYLNADDCMMVELPAFHVGGVAPIMAALTYRARIVVYPGFKTDAFWQRVEEHGVTTTSGLIGSMASFLAKAPPSENDRDNPLRMITLMLNEQAIEVAERYGFGYLSGFNMTELSGPLITELDCKVPGSIGRPRPGCECRVVDDHDYEVPAGEAGELIVRTDQPWTVNMGYLNRPGATAEAWRNGWFHTGDLVRRDADGNFFFVDRKKDAVRRRGENVSSIEVEAEVLGFDGVADAAVVGIESPHGDQEILVAVVPKAGSEVDPRALAEYLVPRMPHYMVPRYIRPLEELPRTPTNKVRKVDIREQGITDDTWDREAAGMRLKRTRFD
ncbi:AMP-binding protein [Elongatibacter sediminis]|uniref:AMP-binding protein n=1 Tax=Elongatibacter sediminis TaxID=3119006 RepID=A0AAW9RDP4_9GAMM